MVMGGILVSSRLTHETFGSFLISVGVTFLVVVLPCALALALRITGAVTSAPLLILISVALSIGLSMLVSLAWRRRTGEHEVLFEDLMIWGWLRHRRFDRLLSRSRSFVGPNSNSDLDPAERAELLERLSEALDACDSRTYGHSRRVARHASQMAHRMKLPGEEIARIRTAALLHDVGKIETPREIIDKPGKLTDEEFDVIKRHPGTGAEMVAALNDPELTAIVRHHHERIDGGGYPDGISGDQIPVGARIIAVADTFDALTSARPYRGAMSHEKAIAIIESESGSQLDAGAVAAFEGRRGGHHKAAFGAIALGAGRQVGQALAGIGSGATQVAAVGAATVVLGTAPIKDRVPVTPPNPRNASAPAASAQAVSGGGVPGSGLSAATTAGREDGRSGRRHRMGDVGEGRRNDRPGGAEGAGTQGSGSGGGGGGNAHGGDSGGSGSGSGSGSAGGGAPGSGSGSGSGSGGGASTPAKPSNPSLVPPPVQGAIDQIPPVPEQVPGSGTINDVVDDVKQLPGKILGGK